MNTPVAKPPHDYFGLGLGLLSWVFPEVPVWIKVLVTISIIVLLIFLRLNKEQQTKTLKATGNFIEDAIGNFIAPAVAGAFKGLFITLILIILTDGFNIIHLINNDYSVLSHDSRGPSFITLALYSLGNLTSTGNVILWIGIIIGAWTKIGEAATENKKNSARLQLNNAMKTTRYTIGTIKSIDKDTADINCNVISFDYMFNSKTYSRKQKIGINVIDISKRYVVGFVPTQPNNADTTFLYGGCIVPDTILEAPAIGWEAMPPEIITKTQIG